MSQTLKSNIEIIAFHNLDASAYQRGISRDMVGMKVPRHDLQNQWVHSIFPEWFFTWQILEDICRVISGNSDINNFFPSEGKRLPAAYQPKPAVFSGVYSWITFRCNKWHADVTVREPKELRKIQSSHDEIHQKSAHIRGLWEADHVEDGSFFASAWDWKKTWVGFDHLHKLLITKTKRIYVK